MDTDNEDVNIIPRDALRRVAAVARRLYSQDRMTADQMRNAAQMLDAALEATDTGAANGAASYIAESHITYDSRLRE